MTNPMNAPKVPTDFVANVRGQPFKVEALDTLPVESLTKIFEYGLQRIFNDAAAGAKQGDKAEALALAQKKLDNLRAGIIRASGERTGDPVRKRALELAASAIRGNATFIKWCQDSGLKIGDKEAQAKIAELSKAQVVKEGNKFTAQAEKDVAAQAALSGLELEL